MTRKPTVAKGYSSETALVVYSTALYLATKLGDLRDEIVVVGGLVPSLLIPQSASATDRPPHVGTMDVDLGLAIALLDQQRYHELCERLRGAGFEPDTNDAGNATSQRWRINADGHRVTVDFLIPATSASDKGGTLRHLEAGFAAVVMPGLELAFADRQLVTLTGDTVHHEQATREIWVCGAGAFTVLKALAFDNRGENKDAYDLIYVLQNYGSSIEDVFERLRPVLQSNAAGQALAILERDFRGMDSVGPKRLAEFLGDPSNEALRADAMGSVRALLGLCRESSTG